MIDKIFKQAYFKALISVLILFFFLYFVKIEKEQKTEKADKKIEEVQTFSTFYDGSKKTPQWQKKLQIWADFWTPIIFAGSNNFKMNFFYSFEHKKFTPTDLPLTVADKAYYDFLLAEKTKKKTNEIFDFKDFIGESNGLYLPFNEVIPEKKAERLDKFSVYDENGKRLELIQGESWQGIFRKIENNIRIELELRDFDTDSPVVILEKNSGDSKIDDEIVIKFRKELTKISFRKKLQSDLNFGKNRRITFHWNNL